MLHNSASLSCEILLRARIWRKLSAIFMAKKIGFTLAWVLITLTIIGVVAALTIPTLWAKIGTIVNSNRKEVIEDRLLEGLN